MPRGNFGNIEQHRKSGSMSSGNRGNSAQHARAGRLGGLARARKRLLAEKHQASDQQADIAQTKGDDHAKEQQDAS